MKILIYAMLCLCACANTQTTPHGSNFEIMMPTSDDYEYVPVVRDPPPPPSDTRTEQQKYSESMLHIEMTMASEWEQLNACKSDCKVMRNRMCSIHAMIDTRGGMHVKPYCK